VWKYWRAHGRHDLPWRLPAQAGKTHDPYRILVSEVMLQQTQVERVIPFYKNFIKKFPTAKKLAKAPLAEVLKSWQGLGYNRRAKMLHQAAKEVTRRGAFPKTVRELEQLPGVGPYTARAIAAFAFNQDVVFVETNIRTAIIHHFFPKRKKVNDRQIEEILRRAAPDVALAKSGEWYSALMDYGSYLKKSGVKLNARNSRYVKQSRFAGSKREARGAILKELTRGPATEPRVLGLLGAGRSLQLRAALAALALEGLVRKHGRYFGLPH
jgi:A/G-specific adenine glycosylase